MNGVKNCNQNIFLPKMIQTLILLETKECQHVKQNITQTKVKL